MGNTGGEGEGRAHWGRGWVPGSANSMSEEQVTFRGWWGGDWFMAGWLRFPVEMPLFREEDPVWQV